jgi:hypothetical protein
LIPRALRLSAHKHEVRRCSHLVRFFNLFPFLLFADCFPFSHMSPTCSSLCYAMRRPPCPSPPAFLCDSTPPPSPRSGTLSLPRLGLGRDVTSPHVSLWDTPHSTPLPFQFIFWFVFLFFFLFSLTAPLLSQVHGDPSRLQMRVGAPLFSNPRARRPCTWFVFCSSFLFPR